MSCPFCFKDNTLLLEEVETNDCFRICVVCTNCGLRGPGVDTNTATSIDDILCEDNLAWTYFVQMAKALENVWRIK